MKNIKVAIAALSVGAVAVLAVTTACAKGEPKGDHSTKTSDSSVVTNENGSVTRTFTECNVTTNGSMVTERRRETRTTMDTDGNVLESSTSECAQCYAAGGFTPVEPRPSIRGESAASAAKGDSFMGLKFGEVVEGKEFTSDPSEPTLLKTAFVPKKALAGFDDYYAYVTPKTHKVVKVYACAKDVVDPGASGASWRRHYLIEALEKRYETWARPRSPFRPIYSFDIGGGRYVTACLAGASCDYETVLVGWDDAMLTVAANETEELREEARKSAREKRKARVSDAAEAF